MDSDRRWVPDRRAKPTPLLSRYTLWGRRATFRRREDREKGGYVDRYGPGLFFLLLLIAGLNLLDSLFTMVILEFGGREVNPIVRGAMEAYGDRFWVWKFLIVSFNLILLCLHSRFRYVSKGVFWVTLLFLGVILYQVLILKLHIL